MRLIGFDHCNLAQQLDACCLQVFPRVVCAHLGAQLVLGRVGSNHSWWPALCSPRPVLVVVVRCLMSRRGAAAIRMASRRGAALRLGSHHHHLHCVHVLLLLRTRPCNERLRLEATTGETTVRRNEGRLSGAAKGRRLQLSFKAGLTVHPWAITAVHESDGA